MNALLMVYFNLLYKNFHHHNRYLFQFSIKKLLFKLLMPFFNFCSFRGNGGIVDMSRSSSVVINDVTGKRVGIKHMALLFLLMECHTSIG